MFLVFATEFGHEGEVSVPIKGYLYLEVEWNEGASYSVLGVVVAVG